MAKETEHKYIVTSNAYRDMAESSVHIIQGYLSRNPDRTVRVRVFGEKGVLTVKGRNHGDTRLEFEYEIPLEDAIELLELCENPVIEKIRYKVPFGGYLWEVDEFNGELNGIVVAEIELPESRDDYPLPPFAGRNVSSDPRWYNSKIPEHSTELKEICKMAETL